MSRPQRPKTSPPVHSVLVVGDQKTKEALFDVPQSSSRMPSVGFELLPTKSVDIDDIRHDLQARDVAKNALNHATTNGTQVAMLVYTVGDAASPAYIKDMTRQKLGGPADKPVVIVGVQDPANTPATDAELTTVANLMGELGAIYAPCKAADPASKQAVFEKVVSKSPTCESATARQKQALEKEAADIVKDAGTRVGIATEEAQAFQSIQQEEESAKRYPIMDEEATAFESMRANFQAGQDQIRAAEATAATTPPSPRPRQSWIYTAFSVNAEADDDINTQQSFESGDDYSTPSVPVARRTLGDDEADLGTEMTSFTSPSP